MKRPSLSVLVGPRIPIRVVIAAFAAVYRLAPDASLIDAYERARSWS